MDTASRRALFEGFRDSLPVMAAFVFLFAGLGVASRGAGLDGWQTAVMTAGVFAAPAQYAVLDSLSGGAWLAALTTTAIVNFRFILMSAALLPRFDSSPRSAVAASLPMLAISTFTVAWTGAHRNPDRPAFAYYLGSCLASYPLAVVMALAGNLAAGQLPATWVAPMGMILPVYFTIMLAGSLPRLRPIAAAAAGFVTVPLLYGVLGHGALAVAAIVIGGAVCLIPDTRAKP